MEVKDEDKKEKENERDVEVKEEPNVEEKVEEEKEEIIDTEFIGNSKAEPEKIVNREEKLDTKKSIVEENSLPITGTDYFNLKLILANLCLFISFFTILKSKKQTANSKQPANLKVKE